jgi:hypothetical protein
MITIFVSDIPVSASWVNIVSMKKRIFAENWGQGTISSIPIMAASFAPRKTVKRRVEAAFAEVARVIMRSKSDLSRVDVYLLYRIQSRAMRMTSWAVDIPCLTCLSCQNVSRRISL